ncbi:MULTISPECIES: precorrin-6y C5,15-methyltransferase (decarboxylating) subunit CbiE [unclassified Treponema]|uniref:precorrin-6y C5,15-methyltransferase (decarboxylating) subunit CbiE n=1 Tax=unclassified Treponema TaxID=2638727 RepID=UPI0020A3A7E2|nr:MULTISPECIES: precorrin-6y C5,15-methyltransferase (decarboxylating) subunit CbiE [unclassified Treponema]UTC67450.1 precorrin-6y C5,15-methyltransferase (decarboxylating) subunit CbiE [Treponema sp. OMZ 789]UTC70178.1 precorrin-6y C5,15-methyltransferase (decarboxylating) subunit CbiE [Treponema sp. OMZ 790]UTC72893.1 precorrin-6y C5,15-methyltransferase (decarboxylating) subunit CbiE [Treponema sp. OMZ 791]
MSLIIAGAGPGNIELLTQEAVREIKEADIVAGFERIALDIKCLRSDVIRLKSISEILDLPIETKKVLVLASGDPCFFGITEFIKKKNIKIEKVITGISSMQYLMSKLQRQWQTLLFYSFHGRDADFREMHSKDSFFILTDKTNNPDTISARLKEEGFNGKLFVGYNLSYPDESIEEYEIGDKIIVKSFLNTVLVQNEKY